MRILYKGAESLIYLDRFEGETVIVKERLKKSYRIEQIDEKLRKYRTRMEVKLLTEARKVGVCTPRIVFVNEKEGKIYMEYIDGIRVKELLETGEKEVVKKVCLKIGSYVGKLHSAGIIHGDLTTSNMILKDDKLYFIDFGLGEFSSRIEDQGVDLNLLQEALRATHFKLLKFCWSNIVKSYKKEYRLADKVLERVVEIEKRARYMVR
jgi:Kae1-associated kinase Bud32